jgi:hypothetical protein
MEINGNFETSFLGHASSLTFNSLLSDQTALVASRTSAFQSSKAPATEKHIPKAFIHHPAAASIKHQLQTFSNILAPPEIILDNDVNVLIALAYRSSLQIDLHKGLPAYSSTS